MKRLMLFRLLAGAMLFAGCTPSQTGMAVYDARRSLLAADNTALAYLGQPPCGATVAVTCVDPAVKLRIKAAEQIAYDAVNQADAARTSGATGANTLAAAAVVAITAYAAAIPK